LHSESNWKPNKLFELTKKGKSQLCFKSQQEGSNDLKKTKNANRHGLTIFKNGKRNLELQADIFPKGFVKIYLRTYYFNRVCANINNKVGSHPYIHPLLLP